MSSVRVDVRCTTRLMSWLVDSFKSLDIWSSCCYLHTQINLLSLRMCSAGGTGGAVWHFNSRDDTQALDWVNRHWWSEIKGNKLSAPHESPSESERMLRDINIAVCGVLLPHRDTEDAPDNWKQDQLFPSPLMTLNEFSHLTSDRSIYLSWWARLDLLSCNTGHPASHRAAACPHQTTYMLCAFGCWRLADMQSLYSNR